MGSLQVLKKSKGLIYLLLFVSLSACNFNGSNSNAEYEAVADHIETAWSNPPNFEVMPNHDRVELPSPSVSNKTCTRTQYSLAKNFDKVAILKPNKGVVWPGAIVKVNQSLTDGLPEPVTLKRSPVTLSIDLPGMRENGTIVVNDPANSSIQAAIDSSLEWWNGNAYRDGHVNPASSSYSKTVSHSSEQTGLELGLNLDWDSGEVSSALQTSTNETKKVVSAVYKQAFYTVTVDTPEVPEAVFLPDTSLESIKQQINENESGAYISNVTYGRIILVRMETSSQASNEEIEAAFEYSLGKRSASGKVQSKYERILNNSDTSFNVVTLGGNPDQATKPITDGSAEGVLDVIRNATYSRSNPGVPISYTVRHLVGNLPVKLGASTEYTATDCVLNSSTVTVNYKGIEVLGDCRLFEGYFYWTLSAQADNGDRIVVDKRLEADALLGDDVGENTYFNINKEESFVMPHVEGSFIELTGDISEKLTGTRFPTFTRKLRYIDPTKSTKNESSPGSIFGVLKNLLAGRSWGVGNYGVELNPTGKVGISPCNVRLDYEVTARQNQ